ncbi:TonB-dependent receptor [bacterium]|nr:TonB-dependent receptor [bacterium]
MRNLILGCLLLLAFPGFSQFTVTGTVVDSATNEALSGASVILHQKHASTNKSGNFTFNEIPEGRAVILVSHVGCSDLSFPLYISSDTHLTLVLSHHIHVFDEVILYAHSDELEPDIRLSQKISSKKIDQIGAILISDALQDVGGVRFLKTGNTIGKPMIHGLHSTRLPVIIGNNTLESQQWGIEHAPEINPFTSGSITVIKGAGSLIYSGSAPAGMLLFETGGFDDSAYSRVLFMGGGSLFHANSGRLGLKLENYNPLTGVGNRLTFTADMNGDVASPNYNLGNTASRQYGASYNLAWSQDFLDLSIDANYFFQSPGILKASHIGNLSDLKRAYESDTPLINREFTFEIDRPFQRIQHGVLHAGMALEMQDSSMLFADYQFQMNHRQEFDVHDEGDEVALQLSLFTHQFHIRYDQHFREHWRQQIGVNMQGQGNIYRGSYFIPNYLRIEAAPYYSLTYEGKKSLIEAALRYDIQQFETFRNENGQTKTDTFNYGDYAAAISGWTIINEDLKLHFSMGTYFKFPEVNELFSDGLHHASAAIEIGNKSLKTERSYVLTVPVLYSHNRWKILIEPYARYFNNYIYLNPTGKSQLSIRGAFPVFEYTQTDVFFRGTDFDIKYHLLSNTLIELSGELIFADDIENNLHIYGIPANKLNLIIGQTRAQFSSLENIRMQLESSYVFEQKRVELQSDFVPPPEGYFIMGLRIDAEQKNIPMSYSLRISNLLNATYRDYLNRYRYFSDEAGRILNFTINYRIK